MNNVRKDKTWNKLYKDMEKIIKINLIMKSTFQLGFIFHIAPLERKVNK